MNFIHKIGLEIEGGWHREKQLSNLKHDGSVHFKRREYKVRGKNETRAIQLGEIASDPLNSIEAGIEWIKNHWPDKRNATCGFHIHISLKDKLFYTMLMDEGFYETFLKSAYDFGQRERMSKEFFRRLEGKNRYCKRMFAPESQIEFVHDHRYTDSNPRYAHLNYCFKTHGTMENRLPTGAMPKGKAIKTLMWYISLVEDYLSNKIKEEKPLIVEIESKPEENEIIDLTETQS